VSNIENGWQSFAGWRKPINLRQSR